MLRIVGEAREREHPIAQFGEAHELRVGVRPRLGERSGRVFQLAGRVRVQVARVDLETAKIDFTLADAQQEQPVRKGSRKAKGRAV